MSLKHMLLGVIKDKPCSGYDLNKTFEYVIHFFWSADRSRIYRTLHQMHADGWVEIEHVEQTDSPDKKVYHITAAGCDALRAWVSTPQPSPPSRIPWLGQVFFGDAASPEELIGVLEARLALLNAELEALLAREINRTAQEFARDPSINWQARLRALTLDYGIHINRSAIEWTERTLLLLREEAARQQGKA